MEILLFETTFPRCLIKQVPMIGIQAMLALRRLPDAEKLAGGRR